MDDLFAHAEAKALRDAGMAQASSRDPSFGDRAFQAIERIARRQPHVHVDDLLSELNERPSSPNAMGAVWLRAIRAGFIERSSEMRPCATDPKKHAHNYPIYFSRIYNQQPGA